MKMMPACTRPTQKPEKQHIPIIVFSLEPRDIKHTTLFICNVITLPPKGASASFVVVLYKSNTHHESKLHSMKMMPACTSPTQKPEKQQIPIIVFSFDPATARTHDLHIRGVHATPLSTIFQLYRGGNALINSEKLLVLYVKML
jgi:hypothetical protein